MMIYIFIYFRSMCRYFLVCHFLFIIKYANLINKRRGQEECAQKCADLFQVPKFSYTDLGKFLIKFLWMVQSQFSLRCSKLYSERVSSWVRLTV